MYVNKAPVCVKSPRAGNLQNMRRKERKKKANCIFSEGTDTSWSKPHNCCSFFLSLTLITFIRARPPPPKHGMGDEKHEEKEASSPAKEGLALRPHRAYVLNMSRSAREEINIRRAETIYRAHTGRDGPGIHSLAVLDCVAPGSRRDRQPDVWPTRPGVASKQHVPLSLLLPHSSFTNLSLLSS